MVSLVFQPLSARVYVYLPEGIRKYLRPTWPWKYISNPPFLDCIRCHHWPSSTSIDRSSSRNLQPQVRWLTNVPKKKRQKWWIKATKMGEFTCRNVVFTNKNVALPCLIMFCLLKWWFVLKEIVTWDRVWNDNYVKPNTTRGYTWRYPPMVKMNFGCMDIYIQDHTRFRWLQVDQNILLGFQELAASCCFLSILVHESWCFAGERTIQ